MKHFNASPEPKASPCILAFDISRDKLNVFTRIAGREHDLELANDIPTIETELQALASRARLAGTDRVLVVAESTGPYHRPLMRIARQLKLETAWVSPEAVAKMRVIETNDTGKTDLKDPHVIYSLASMGKLLRHREFPEPYNLLREHNALYEEAEVGVVQAKCAIHDHLKALFPEFGFKKDFLFGPSGQALFKLFACNPYEIVNAGRKRFFERMKKAVPGIRPSSLERLFEQAEKSVRLDLQPRYVAALELRLRRAWEDYELHERRRQETKHLMEALYREARRQDPHLPGGQKGVITEFHLSRIVAETGPLGDFSSWRELLRFAGLNLREKQSGTFRGKTRISRKGRPLLRKSLSQIVLPLVKKGALYGDYYHGKRDNDKMPGSKAITAVSRRFLKVVFGWYKAGTEFDEKRVFVCESRYKKAA